MHLKLFLLGLVFFTLTSAENIRVPEAATKSKVFVAPKKSMKKIYVIPVCKNNVWTKTQAEILDCKIKIRKERDTIQQVLDSVKPSGE